MAKYCDYHGYYDATSDHPDCPHCNRNVRVMLEKEISPELPFGSLGTLHPEDVPRWPDRGMYRVRWDAGFETRMRPNELAEYRE